MMLAADGSLDFGQVGVWLNDPDNWKGPQGVLVRIGEHLRYCGIALAIALLIALPLGLLIGHTGRGVVAIAGTANALRSLPSFGLIILLVVWISPRIHVKGGTPYLVPVEIALVLLALPPILTNTYAGVQNIEPAVRDAARGMGMTGPQVVRRVEFPCALPLIISGFRSATLQVIATATVAAYLPFLGGLGRLLLDGLDQLNDPRFGYPKMVAGAIMVALLAVAADLVLLGLQRLVVSPGVSGRFSRRQRKPDVLTAELTELAPESAPSAQPI